MLLRITLTGLLRISLPVRLGPRLGVISPRTTDCEKVKEVVKEVGAEVGAGAEERAVEDLPILALAVELKKKHPSPVDRPQCTVAI